MSPYLENSRSPYYAVITSIPLLVSYEMLLTFSNGGMSGQVRNAGDVWLRMLLGALDVRAAHATLVMILILFISIPVVKKERITLRGRYLALMGLEALVYSLGLGLAINVILEFIFSAIPSSILGRLTLTAALHMQEGVLQGLALSIGAGLFEEFIFRVLLLGGLLAVTRRFLPSQMAGVLSVVLASLLFSAAHYIGPLGDSFQFGGFMFRFIAGLLFTALYYMRGFSIAAYSHALFDIRVILF